MNDVNDRRQLAALYRRLAEVPTSGGYTADRALVALAEHLEREGSELWLSGPTGELNGNSGPQRSAPPSSAPRAPAATAHRRIR
jgi:hypothetical protein